MHPEPERFNCRSDGVNAVSAVEAVIGQLKLDGQGDPNPDVRVGQRAGLMVVRLE